MTGQAQSHTQAPPTSSVPRKCGWPRAVSVSSASSHHSLSQDSTPEDVPEEVRLWLQNKKHRACNQCRYYQRWVRLLQLVALLYSEQQNRSHVGYFWKEYFISQELILLKSQKYYDKGFRFLALKWHPHDVICLNIAEERSLLKWQVNQMVLLLAAQNTKIIYYHLNLLIVGL